MNSLRAVTDMGRVVNGLGAVAGTRRDASKQGEPCHRRIGTVGPWMSTR